MPRFLFLSIIAASLILAGCASDQRSDQRSEHVSYGPPPMFPGPDGSSRNVQSMTNWGATDEHFGHATPGPFKGY